VARRLQCLLNCSYCFALNMVRKHPTLEIADIIKVEKLQPKPLTDENMLDYLSDRDPKEGVE